MIATPIELSAAMPIRQNKATISSPALTSDNVCYVKLYAACVCLPCSRRKTRPLAASCVRLAGDGLVQFSLLPAAGIELDDDVRH